MQSEMQTASEHDSFNQRQSAFLLCGGISSFLFQISEVLGGLNLISFVYVDSNRFANLSQLIAALSQTRFIAFLMHQSPSEVEWSKIWSQNTISLHSHSNSGHHLQPLCSPCVTEEIYHQCLEWSSEKYRFLYFNSPKPCCICRMLRAEKKKNHNQYIFSKILRWFYWLIKRR